MSAADRLEAVAQAVFDLHKPVSRYLVDGHEERSWASRELASTDTEVDPSRVYRWTQCAECARVEDGPDGEGPLNVGYANADYPCPTVRAVEAALGVDP